MAMKYSGRELKWMKSTIGDAYLGVLRVEGNSTSTPDGDEPSSIVWARTGVGTYTFTFPALDKPRRILSCEAKIEEDSPTLSARFTGYVASTGVGTVKIYESEGSATLKMYNLGLRFTGANGSNPTSPDPTTDITWVRTGEGVWTGTFSAGTKPLEVTAGTCNVEGGAAGDSAQVDGYVYATGVLTVKGWTQSVATQVADDLDGKVVAINLLCTDTAIAATVAAQKAAQIPAAADMNDKTLVLTFVASNSQINDA